MADVELEVIDLSTGQSAGVFSLTLCEAKAYELDTGSYRFKATYLVTSEVQEADRSIVEGENPSLDFVFAPPPPPPAISTNMWIAIGAISIVAVIGTILLFRKHSNGF